MVAAAEDRVLETVHSLVRALFQPLHELLSVVRWSAVVRGDESHHGPLVRQSLHDLVELHLLNHETHTASILSYPISEVPTGPHVGPVKHRKRSPLGFDSPLLLFSLLLLLSGRPFGIRAWLQKQLEVGRLDSERADQMELVRFGSSKTVALQHHRQHQGRFTERKGPPDASSLSCAKRLVAIGRTLLLGFREKTIRVEALRVRPNPLVSM